jgi:hypothetical protein
LDAAKSEVLVGEKLPMVGILLEGASSPLIYEKPQQQQTLVGGKMARIERRKKDHGRKGGKERAGLFVLLSYRCLGHRYSLKRLSVCLNYVWIVFNNLLNGGVILCRSELNSLHNRIVRKAKRFE